MQEYLNTIYEYYPKDLYPSDLKYVETPEITKQWELIESKKMDTGDFNEMIARIGSHLNCTATDDLLPHIHSAVNHNRMASYHECLVTNQFFYFF